LRNKHANDLWFGKRLIMKNIFDQAARCRDADTCLETAKPRVAKSTFNPGAIPARNSGAERRRARFQCAAARHPSAPQGRRNDRKDQILSATFLVSSPDRCPASIASAGRGAKVRSRRR
jgi:hypothetical protein